MIMSAVGLRIKNYCADEGQQQFTGPSNIQASSRGAGEQWQFVVGREESPLLAAAT
jgi:hypothetical protein